jgi:hypothetical protein
MRFFLKETIFLLPILLMGVSFLSIFFDLNFVVWGNIGGYSLITDVLFVYVFWYGKYCLLTRLLPFGLIFSNLLNIYGFYYPKHYNIMYEIVIFSVILSGVLIYELNKRIFK